MLAALVAACGGEVREVRRYPAAREGDALMLGEQEFEFHGLRGVATFLEVVARPTVRITLTNPTDSNAYWVDHWPGCHWSDPDATVVWAKGRPEPDIRRSLLSSVGCSWFEGLRAPTREEIDGSRIPPGGTMTGSYSFHPEDWHKQDAQWSRNGRASFESWSFSEPLAIPMPDPPSVLPQGWKRQELHFSWSEGDGAALELGRELPGFIPHD